MARIALASNGSVSLGTAGEVGAFNEKKYVPPRERDLSLPSSVGLQGRGGKPRPEIEQWVERTIKLARKTVELTERL
jgi:hypothetical protein